LSCPRRTKMAKLNYEQELKDLENEYIEIKTKHQLILSENALLAQESQQLREDTTKVEQEYSKEREGNHNAIKDDLDQVRAHAGLNGRKVEVYKDFITNLDNEHKKIKEEIFSVLFTISHTVKENEQLKMVLERMEENLTDGSLHIAFELLFEKFIKELLQDDTLEYNVKKGAIKKKKDKDKSKKKKKNILTLLMLAKMNLSMRSLKLIVLMSLLVIIRHFIKR